VGTVWGDKKEEKLATNLTAVILIYPVMAEGEEAAM
jgi:hypothetical protein